jgi:hypothetical protein
MQEEEKISALPEAERQALRQKGGWQCLERLPLGRQVMAIQPVIDDREPAVVVAQESGVQRMPWHQDQVMYASGAHGSATVVPDHPSAANLALSRGGITRRD